MNSKERMLGAIEHKEIDYTPCSFMLFSNQYDKCKTEKEHVEKQLEMGLDPYVHVGHLNHTMHLNGTLHPDVKSYVSVEELNGIKYFNRILETPKGILKGRIRQQNGWPTEENLPIFKDWILPRAEEILVKPEEDLDKLKYIFGPFKDEDIKVLKEEAGQARALAQKYNLIQVGGWKGSVKPGLQVDPGVMGCDAISWLSGFEEIMILSLTNPEIIKEYCSIIHEWNMKQIEIYLDVTDADLIFRRGWYETTEFWTPQAYKTIVAPILKKEVDLVHQSGKKFGYIITSAFLPILDDILDTGIDVLIGLDPKEGKGTDMNVVKEKFRVRKKGIWGGVSGPISLEISTAEETRNAVIEALQVFKEKRGFILSPVDNVRDDTENAWENTKVLIDTWKKYRN